MIQIDDSTVRLSGIVTNTTVPSLLAQLDSLPPAEIELDLSGVTHVDSAAVSLLLNLRRQRGRQVRVSHIPDNLRALIQLYDLDEILCQSAQ